MTTKKTLLISIIAASLSTMAFANHHHARHKAAEKTSAATSNTAADANESTVGVTTPVLTQSGLNPAQALIPQPPRIDAKAYVLMDANSGAIIAEKNMNDQRAPASLTKLMTLYLTEKALADGRLTLDTPVHISDEAYKTGGSKMFVKAGTDVPVKDLMLGIIVDSGNDAAVALAQKVGGGVSSFVDLMNEEAQFLGMKNTHFMTVDGLPDYEGQQFSVQDQHSSAYDLAMLARAIITHYPQYYSLFDQRSLTFSHITQQNRNHLIWQYPGVDGLKTGYTKDAGYCLIASAKKDNSRLISVALGAEKEADRDRDDAALLTYGFMNYDTIQKFVPNTALTMAPVSGDVTRTIPVGVTQAMYVTVPHGQDAKLVTQLNLNKINGAVDKNAPLGTVSILLNGNPMATQPLVALQADPAANIGRRLLNDIEAKL